MVCTAELVNASGLRRTDIDPIKQIERRSLALGQLGKFRPRFDQVLADFGTEVLINLNDLKLDLSNLTFGLRDQARQLTALAFQASGITL